MTDGSLQLNETNIPLSFGNVVSIAFRSVRKGNLQSHNLQTTHGMISISENKERNKFHYKMLESGQKSAMQYWLME
uniref:Uncharacterized protein n=1 Tax=Romanomermis culicivorax TaxID=13658 RepID=A0A915ISC0_ROMCU